MQSGFLISRRHVRNPLHGGGMVGIDVSRVWRDGLGPCCAGRVDGVAQLFGGLEERHALGRDIDFSAGLGITSGAGVALPCAEASEAANLNLVASLQSSDDGFEEGIDDDLPIASGEVAQGGDFIYEVSFSHKRVPFGAGEGDRGPVRPFRCC